MAKFRDAIVDRHNNLNKWIADPQCKGLYARVGQTGTVFYERLSTMHTSKKRIRIGNLFDAETKTGLTIPEARRHVDRLRGQLLTQTPAEQQAESRRKITTSAKLGDLIETILDQRAGYPARFANLQAIMPDILNTPAHKLSLEQIHDWRNQYMQQTIIQNGRDTGQYPKPKTVNDKTNTLSAFLSALVAHRLIHTNIMLGRFKKLTEKQDGRKRFLGKYQDEEAAFWEQVDRRDDWASYAIQLIYLCARRKSEILSLRWDEIDLKTHTVTKQHHKNFWRHHEPLEFHLIDEALDILNAWKQKTHYPAYSPIRCGEEWVFYNPKTGTHVKDLDTAWKTLLAKSGIKNLTRHDLRRTAGTKAAMSGANAFQIGEMLGDSDMRSVKIYAKIAEEQTRDMMSQVLTRRKR